MSVSMFDVRAEGESPRSIMTDGVEDLVKSFRSEARKNNDKEIRAEWTALLDTLNKEMVRQGIKEIRNEEFRVVVGSPVGGHDRISE